MRITWRASGRTAAARIFTAKLQSGAEQTVDAGGVSGPPVTEGFGRLLVAQSASLLSFACAPPKSGDKINAYFSRLTPTTYANCLVLNSARTRLFTKGVT